MKPAGRVSEVKTAVRPADLEADQALIIEFLARHHTDQSTQARYDWLYRNSPAGEARIWISFDEGTQATVGVAAGFPRQICFEGKLLLGCVLGDFCIESRYRTLGPAMQLQRTCLAGLGATGNLFYYDFPSPHMTAVYRRLGIAPALQMTRLVKVLRVNTRLYGLIKHQPLANAVSSVANLGLDLLNGNDAPPDGADAAIHRSACRDEFTELAGQVGASAGICLWRSAEYLNWRYLQHPYRQHEILVVRRKGTLLGYGVTVTENLTLNLVDVFGMTGAIKDIVSSVVALAKSRNLETISVGMLVSHPWFEILRQLGFAIRESIPVVAGNAGNREPGDFHPPDHWLLVNGDRES